MKKFIKGRWFPLTVSILIDAIVVIVAFIMALFGWRITYAPELENSWEAISAVAAWFGAIGTVTAVFSAIWVANRQNKITMFERRWDVLKRIEKYILNMDSWEYKYEWFQKLMLSEFEVKILFDNEFAAFYLELEKESLEVNSLWGDYEYAKYHVECHGKSEEQIETEIRRKVTQIRISFKEIKEKMYSKYLCI